MSDWHIPMAGIQIGFFTGYALSHEHGTYDPFGYFFRTVLVVIYTVFSWSRQETGQNLADWICQSICMVQYISVVLNLISFDSFLWRRNG
jgi:hypothetical protein